MLFLLNRLLRDRIKQQIGNVVRQRAANEKLHREVVDSLRIFTFVRVFSMYPSLRKDVTNRVGKRFKPRPSVGCAEIHDVVKNKVAFIQGVIGSGELNRTAAILLQQFGNTRPAPLGLASPLRFVCSWGSLDSLHFLCSSNWTLLERLCLFLAVIAFVPDAVT